MIAQTHPKVKKRKPQKEGLQTQLCSPFFVVIDDYIWSR